MVSDQDRRELYEALERRLGQGPAGTMMELLPPVGWPDVARQSDLVAVRGEMAEVRGEMAELRGEMAELRAELKGEIAELRGELRAQLPRLYAANIASMIGVAGLVLAGSKLA
jgi:hypothetical protein